MTKSHWLTCFLQNPASVIVYWCKYWRSMMSPTPVMRVYQRGAVGTLVVWVYGSKVINMDEPESIGRWLRFACEIAAYSLMTIRLSLGRLSTSFLRPDTLASGWQDKVRVFWAIMRPAMSKKVVMVLTRRLQRTAINNFGESNMFNQYWWWWMYLK